MADEVPGSRTSKRKVRFKRCKVSLMENIVLQHELGHDTLNKEEATKIGGFEEFNILDIRDNQMEYEANVFLAQISLPDEEFPEYYECGYDILQIARTMHSDVNLVALKSDTLSHRDTDYDRRNTKTIFLKYNK